MGDDMLENPDENMDHPGISLPQVWPSDPKRNLTWISVFGDDFLRVRFVLILKISNQIWSTKNHIEIRAFQVISPPRLRGLEAVLMDLYIIISFFGSFFRVLEGFTANSVARPLGPRRTSEFQI